MNKVHRKRSNVFRVHGKRSLGTSSASSAKRAKRDNSSSDSSSKSSDFQSYAGKKTTPATATKRFHQLNTSTGNGQSKRLKLDNSLASKKAGSWTSDSDFECVQKINAAPQTTPAQKGKPKVKAKKDSSSSSDSSSEDEAPKKAAIKPPPAQKRTTVRDKKDSSSSSDSSSEDEAPMKPTAKTTPAQKGTPVVKAKKDSSSSSDSSSEDEAPKKAATKPPPAQKGTPTAKSKKERSSDSDSSSEDETPKKAATKTPPAQKGTPTAKAKKDSSFSSDSSSEDETPKKAATKTQPVQKGTSTVKAKKDSSYDSDYYSKDEAPMKPTAKTTPAQKGTPTAKAKKERSSDSDSSSKDETPKKAATKTPPAQKGTPAAKAKIERSSDSDSSSEDETPKKATTKTPPAQKGTPKAKAKKDSSSSSKDEAPKKAAIKPPPAQKGSTVRDKKDSSSSSDSSSEDEAPMKPTAKTTPAQKGTPVVKSKKERSSDSDSSSEDEAPKKAAIKPPPAQKGTTVRDKKDSSSSSDSSSEDEAPMKPTAKTTPAQKGTPVVKAKKDSSSSSDSSSEDEAPNKAATKTTPAQKGTPTVKSKKERSSDSDSSSKDEAPKKAAIKPPPAQKGTTVRDKKDSSSSSDSSSEDEAPMKPTAKTTPAQKGTPVVKAKKDSSSSSDSSSEDEAPNKAATKTTPAQKGTPTAKSKKERSSDSDSSSEDETPKKAVTKTPPAQKGTPTAKAKKDSSSSSDSSSEDEAPKKPTAKTPPAQKGTPTAKAKKDFSSSSDSSSKDETPKKAATKTQPVQKGTPTVKAKKDSSSDSDSSSEDEAPNKAATKTTPAQKGTPTAKAKKDSSSSSDSSSEDEAPNKAATRTTPAQKGTPTAKAKKDSSSSSDSSSEDEAPKQEQLKVKYGKSTPKGTTKSNDSSLGSFAENGKGLKGSLMTSSPAAKAINGMNGGSSEDYGVLYDNDKTSGKVPKKSPGTPFEEVEFDPGLQDNLFEAKETNIDMGPFYGLPSNVKQLFETQRGIKELYTWQDECLRLPKVLKGGNLIYTLPTSGGKTLVAEILILRELLCKKKDALLILPFVSIVQEKVRSLSQFAVDLDFLVEEYAGSKGKFPPIKQRKRKSLYIATIEKAHSIINSLIENKNIGSLGLVVVDELHMIGEGGHRGAILESTIIKILYASGEFPYASVNTRIIGMSATLSNIDDLRLFLKADVYNSDFRPVELTEYVKLEDNIYFLDPKSKDKFQHDRVVTFQYTPEMLKMDCEHLFGLTLEVIPNKSCLIFCPTKKNCESVAMMLAKMMMKFRRDLSNVKRVERKALLKELYNDAAGKICPVLLFTVNFGIAYHHSGLTMDERKLLEEAYSEGTLCLLTCTSTLAAGVNLPVKRVILRSPYVGNQFMSQSQYKQMVGRAGRACIDTSGESILITKPADKEKVCELVSGPLGSCHSSLLYDEGKGLQNIMLSSIGLALTPTTKDVFKFMEKSLLNIQQAVLKADMSALFCNALQKLIDLKLVVQKKAVSPDTVENNEFTLEVTPLGRAAFKGPVDLEYAGMLYSDLKKAEESLVLSNYLHLLYLVTPYDAVKDVSPSWIIYFHQMNTFDPVELKVACVIGVPESYIIKKAAGQTPKQDLDKFVVNRFYLTLMLYDVWKQRSVWEVAEKFQMPRGFIQNLLTRESGFAACVQHFCEELDEFWAFKDLLGNFVKRLTYCVSAELIPLMEIAGVKLGRAKLLFNAGFKTLSSIANADPESLVKGVEYMPRKVARQIVTSAKALIQEKTEALLEEVENLVTIPDTTWKKSEASPDQMDTETMSDAVSPHLSQRSTLSSIILGECDSQPLL